MFKRITLVAILMIAFLGLVSLSFTLAQDDAEEASEAIADMIEADTDYYKPLEPYKLLDNQEPSAGSTPPGGSILEMFGQTFDWITR